MCIYVYIYICICIYYIYIYVYIYIYGTPPELSTNFGGEKRVGLHDAPDPSLVQVSIEFLRLLNSIGLTDPPVGGGIVCILPLTPSLVQGLLTTPSSHNPSARLSSPEY